MLAGHKGPVAALGIAPDGASLASASWDHTVRLWPLARTGDPRVFEGHTQGVNGVDVLPRWHRADHSRIRCDAAHLASPSRCSSCRDSIACAAQYCCGRARRRDHHRGRGWKSLSPFRDRQDQRRDPGWRIADHLGCAFSRWSPDCCRQHPWLRCAHRTQVARASAHPGRPGPAGMVRRLPPRQPHAVELAAPTG